METGFTTTFGEGWHQPEHDGRRSFRWTGRRARLSIAADRPGRLVWLRLECAAWGPRAAPPSLAVLANGRLVGRQLVDFHPRSLAFQLGPGASFDVELVPDSTVSAPGDGRELGVVAWSAEAFDEHGLCSVRELDGWYEHEDCEYFPFRWMGPAARLLLPPSAPPGGDRFATIPVFAESVGAREMTVFAGNEPPARLGLLPGWHLYDVPLPGDGNLFGSAGILTLRVDDTCPPGVHPGDPRPLGVRVGPVELHADRRRHAAIQSFHEERRPASGRAAVQGPPAGAELACGLPVAGGGWHCEERDEGGAFRWMKLEARLRLPPGLLQGRRFCSLPVFSAYRNLAQHLDVSARGRDIARFELPRGWHVLSLALPPADGSDLEVVLRVDRLTPAASHPEDPRELGVRVGPLVLHDDEGRQKRESFIVENAVRNQREMQGGATELRSFPQTLGIDLYARCNIKPACVYCLWDPMKALEGENAHAAVDDRTLQAYGPLFEASRLLVNCSFGEPLLHPRLEQVIELAAAGGKVMELSTNGQAFTPRTVRLLAGKRVHLYVSLDAATRSTYARLRNERWDEVLAGLLFLRDAREAGGGWPRLNMVFMPMPANLGDLEPYFGLCRLVEADNLVLRPLLHLERPQMVRERGGYRFDYERELMTRAELEPVFEACGRYAAKYEVRVVSQFDFGLEQGLPAGAGAREVE